MANSEKLEWRYGMRVRVVTGEHRDKELVVIGQWRKDGQCGPRCRHPWPDTKREEDFYSTEVEILKN